jgi:hypothetical protein
MLPLDLDCSRVMLDIHCVSKRGTSYSVCVFSISDDGVRDEFQNILHCDDALTKTLCKKGAPCSFIVDKSHQNSSSPDASLSFRQYLPVPCIIFVFQKP